MASNEVLRGLYAKYNDVIQEIYKKNNVDTSVCWNMLLHELHARKGRFGRTHKYEGVSENFNWDELERDYQAFLAPKEEAK